MAEVNANEIRVASLRRENWSRRNTNTPFQSELMEAKGLNALRELDPQHVTAFWACNSAAALGKVSFQGLSHAFELRRQCVPQRSQMSFTSAMLQILDDRNLGQRSRR